MTPYQRYSLNWNEGDLNAAKSGNIVIRYLMLNKHELTPLKKMVVATAALIAYFLVYVSECMLQI